MKAKTQQPATEEPIGIVISRGAQQERPPVFFAYVWGPAPEDDTPESNAA